MRSDSLVGTIVLVGALTGYYYVDKAPSKPEIKMGAECEAATEAGDLFDVSTSPVESVIPAELQKIPLPPIDLENSAYPEEIRNAPETKAAQFFQDLWAQSQDEWDGFVRWTGPIRRIFHAVRENRAVVRDMRQERAEIRQGYYPPAPEAPSVDNLVPVEPEVIPEPEPTPVEQVAPIVGENADGVPECKCGPDCPCRQKPQVSVLVPKAIIAPKAPSYKLVQKQGWVKVCNLNGGCHYEMRTYVERVPE